MREINLYQIVSIIGASILVVIVVSFQNTLIVPNSSVASLISLSPSNFEKVLTDPKRQLIDIRTPEEFNAGHLNTAKNIDFYNPNFIDSLQALDKNEPYAIYCRSGNRTSQTLSMMKAIGFTDVVELNGGLVAWEANKNSLCTNNIC